MQDASAEDEAVSLVELFYKVPLLWDLLDGKCLKVLLSTNKALRNQSMDHVHCIRTDRYPDMGHLTCNWARLQVLDMTSLKVASDDLRLLLRQSKISVARLSEGFWPDLQQLSLGRYTDLNAGVMRSFSGKWPLLQAFSTNSSQLTQAAMSALIGLHWPLLRTLSIQPSDDAMPELMNSHSSWPQLRHLSISCLSEFGLQHLRHCPWGKLTRLQLSHCIMSDISTKCLVAAHLPNLQDLSLFENPTSIYMDLDGYTCCRALAKGKWPLLGKLELKGVKINQASIGQIVTGNWPLLHAVVLDGVDIVDKEVLTLSEAYWPALKSLTLLGFDFETITVLELCVQKWPGLESLTLPAASSEVSAAIVDQLFLQANNQWPSLQVHFASRF